MDLRIPHKTPHSTRRNHSLECDTTTPCKYSLHNSSMALSAASAPVLSASPPPAVGQPAATTTALRCLSAAPHLHHPQPSNGAAAGCGYRAYSMIQYCSGFSHCDPVALPSPTAFPLLTPPSSGPIRAPTFFPSPQQSTFPYQLAAAAAATGEKYSSAKSQEAASALLRLQREPVVMAACSQPHPTTGDNPPHPLQSATISSISQEPLAISDPSCSHPTDVQINSVVPHPPVLSHCNSADMTSPPTPMSNAHAYGATTPFSGQNIGSILHHLPPSYPYLPFTAHELYGGTYSCHICGKTYVRPATLRSHMKSHSGEKPYQCSICHKSFSQATNLTAHLRTHSGEKPFTCRVCHRGFSQSSSVTTHMRTHSGDRPYKCNVCNKGFADSSTLTKHYRTHTGEKPYQCKICEARFSQSGNLNRHMRTHRHYPVDASSMH